MSAIINGSSPSVTFSDGTTQATSAIVSGYVPYANLPAGSVLQVVSGRISDNRYSTTSTSFTSLGTTLSITPKFATSKILLRYIASVVTATGQEFVYDFRRGSTQNISGYSAGIISSTPADAWQAITVEYLDSPATTSTLTYGASVKVTGGTGYFGDYSANTGTSFIIMEIAG